MPVSTQQHPLEGPEDTDPHEHKRGLGQRPCRAGSSEKGFWTEDCKAWQRWTPLLSKKNGGSRGKDSDSYTKKCIFASPQITEHSTAKYSRQRVFNLRDENSGSATTMKTLRTTQ